MAHSLINFAEKINLDFISRFLTRLNRRIVARRLMKQTRNELQSLSNRELTDMGITRGEIPRVAKEAYENQMQENENIKGWI